MRKDTLLVLLRFVLSSGLAAVPALCSTGVSASSEGTTSFDSHASPRSKRTGAKSNWEKDPSACFGAHVPLPNIPPISGAPSGPNSGSTSGSFNGAGLTGFEIRKSRWSADGQFLYASVSGDHTGPKVHLFEEYPEVSRKPGVWDPLIGFAEHVGPALRLAALHFRVSDTVFDNTEVTKTLTVRQTLYGPILGFGIYI